jgi:hypothetical protein
MHTKYFDVDRSESFRLLPEWYKASTAGFSYGFLLWFAFWLWLPMKRKDYKKPDRRYTMPDGPVAPNDGWRYEE